MDRKCSLNAVQKLLITDFLKSNPALQSGKFSKDFTFKKAQGLWEELTAILNSIPNGSKKDWKQWRKTWQDLKKNTKAKAASVKKHTRTTGGGEPAHMSKLDTEILDMISPTQVNGLSALKETTIKFDFQQNGEKSVLVIGQDKTLDENTEEINSDIDFTEQRESVFASYKDQNMLLDGDEIIEEIELENLTSPEVAFVNQTPSTQVRQGFSATTTTSSSNKKMNKTTRLTKSLDISNNLVDSINERNKILSNYYREKITYLKNDLQMKEKTISVLNDIKNILHNAYGSNS